MATETLEHISDLYLRSLLDDFPQIADSARIVGLRDRVRSAMYGDAVVWECPTGDFEIDFSEPIAIRKAKAIAFKLRTMPTDLWDGQLIAGSLTLENPRLHLEKSFPNYLSQEELGKAEAANLTIGCFGHIVPDYPALLSRGLLAIRRDAEEAKKDTDQDEQVFLSSVCLAIDGVLAFARRVSDYCRAMAASAAPDRAPELLQMSKNLQVVPAGPAQDFWQALQSIWLLHMVFHVTKNNNAIGRLDATVWPYLKNDLQSGTISLERAAELVDCFTLKFNERAQTTEEQLPDHRKEEDIHQGKRHRFRTSSQLGTQRDSIDATNHWLQNIILGGMDSAGNDCTNPLSFLILRSFERNKMTNPLVTIRMSKNSPLSSIRYGCEVLKNGGGMPAFFNDEVLVPALQNLGIPLAEARDYTNDGCWEVIIPGRTDFLFQRLSVLMCLEWALNRGVTRKTGGQEGLDIGDPRDFGSFDDVWQAFLTELEYMVGRTVETVMQRRDERNLFAPVPLLSALIEGPVAKRRDLTAGGAKYQTYGMLAESVPHVIDSLAAIKKVVFEDKSASMSDLCDALDADFVGYDFLRKQLRSAPSYGNDDPYADEIAQNVIDAFTSYVTAFSKKHSSSVLFTCGAATFSWYIGIGEGLGPSADGRLSGAPVSSNLSPALGRDMQGVPSAILSYGSVPHHKLPAGGPLDLRIPKASVIGDEGTDRLVGLVRSFVATGGSMMTITIADTEELRAAQKDPDRFASLRVRMGGWCAYFTALSEQQQEHHIARQEKGG